MKYLIRHYLYAILIVLPLSGHALTLSQEIPEGVTITSVVMDRTEELKNDHYICLGDGWNKANAQVHNKLNSLQKTYPKLLKDMGEGQKNCFASAEVPALAQKSIDEILALIDSGAEDKLHAVIGIEGKPTLSPEVSRPSFYKPICYGTGTGLDAITKLNNDIGKFELRNQNSSLGKKLLRAEYLVGGAELVGMGTLIALPRSITKWDEDWKDDALRNLKRAWTSAPVWDKDDFLVNYLGHPMAGAYYYNLLRSQGATRVQSLLFSTLQSTIWEYGIEAIAERPSIQDLFVTPLIGSVIGELAHIGTQKMRQNGFTLAEKIVVTIINPAYVLNNGYRTK